MNYAKAIFPYQTAVQGDLQLQVDDVVQILKEIDENWFEARFNEQTGLVPRQFVEILPDVELNDNQSLYVAHSDYTSTYAEDLQLKRGDLLVVDETLSNGWFRGTKFHDPRRSTGIFPHTFVTFIKSTKSLTIQKASSQNDLINFDEKKVQFVRVIRDVKSTSNNDSTFYEDEILAVIEDRFGSNEYLTVKNAFDRVGRIRRDLVEPIDERQADDVNHELLYVPKIEPKPSAHRQKDPFQDLVDQKMNEFKAKADFSRNCQPIYPAGTNLAFSHAYSTSSLTSNYFNSNNNNNILDVQSLYTSLPLNQFTTPNHYVYSSSKAIEPVCQTPSTGSSLSSFDELPPPVKPRYSIRPQLPPPPPPPTAAPNFLNSTLTWQGPTRPAPKPPVQSISRKDSIQFRSISNPFERHLYNDDRNSIRDSCDVETSSTRTDFFGLELENLQNQLAATNQVDKTDKNAVQRFRQHVISELVSTERDYLNDLDLIIETFLGPTAIVCDDSVNKNLLFGNVNQISDISRRLLHEIETEYRKSQQSDDAHCCIGRVFNGLAEPLKTNYAEYCRNHEFVQVYLRKNSGNEKVQEYLQHGLAKIRLKKSNVFDIAALLLRPIQRIVRYPLILNELCKNTPTDHVDYSQLSEAINNFVSVVNFINEYKRRKEIVSKYQRREKDEALTNKLYKLNMHTMRKKSARIGMRLSTVFGLTSHVVDKNFHFEEQRFHSLEKFLRFFVRNAYTCMEGLKENLVTQVNVAEDFRNLLDDKTMDFVEEYLKLKRSLLENAFAQFCEHMESCVANPINTLIKLFVLPSNLISKRHDKLLDFHSAQSAFDRCKEPNSRQAKQVLDLAKKTYEALNAQLLEELPLLYDYSCQIISMSLRAFLCGHFRLVQQMQTLLHQISLSVPAGQLSWLQIVERFSGKTSKTSEQIFQLTITAKNFTEKVKHLPPSKLSSFNNQFSRLEQNFSTQNEENRRTVRNRFAETNLFMINTDFQALNQSKSSETTLRNGDLVGMINESDNFCVIDNGVDRFSVPRSILTSKNSSLTFATPPAPIRRDLTANVTKEIGFRASLLRDNNSTDNRLTNADHQMSFAEKENERIYLNQIHRVPTPESHAYASIDLDEPNTEDSICVALYDFQCESNGILSLNVGEKLKVIRRVDDAGNADWWYVEKVHRPDERGYVPANYIQIVNS